MTGNIIFPSTQSKFFRCIHRKSFSNFLYVSYMNSFFDFSRNSLLDSLGIHFRKYLQELLPRCLRFIFEKINKTRERIRRKLRINPIRHSRGSPRLDRKKKLLEEFHEENSGWVSAFREGTFWEFHRKNVEKLKKVKNYQRYYSRNWRGNHKKNSWRNHRRQFQEISENKCKNSKKNCSSKSSRYLRRKYRRNLKINFSYYLLFRTLGQ